MAFYTGTRIRAGDRVREKDGRHIARVDSLALANHEPIFANLTWIESGWRSLNVDVESLELA